jgi:hypothetical protein
MTTNLNLRPFDAFGKLLQAQGNTHQTISGDVAAGIRKSNISVDVYTPEIPDAMDRIRKRNTSKKLDKINQKKKMEEYLEMGKE